MEPQLSWKDGLDVMVGVAVVSVVRNGDRVEKFGRTVTSDKDVPGSTSPFGFPFLDENSWSQNVGPWYFFKASNKLVHCAQAHQMQIVSIVKGIAKITRSQVWRETFTLPVSVECTNWVEKKFFIKYKLK